MIGAALSSAPAFRNRTRHVTVTPSDRQAATMAVVDEGEGDPIVLLHGNPTSSFLWRTVIDRIGSLGRIVAPDLVGMGDSERLRGDADDRYRLVEHRGYLDALLTEIGVADATGVAVVAHDWGAALGVDWARRHADRAAAFREAGESRRPILTWVREIPLDDDPGDVAAIVGTSAAWLRTADVPRLVVLGEPGTLVEPVVAELRSWPRSTEITVPGVHFLTEDAGPQIGDAIARWLPAARD